MGNLFKQDFCDKQLERLYLKTATLASVFLKKMNFDAIAYPSISAELNKICLAIKPEVVSGNFEFAEARVLQVTEVKTRSKIHVKCRLISRQSQKEGVILWQPSQSCNGHWIDSDDLLH